MKMMGSETSLKIPLQNLENQHLIGVMHQTEELFRKIKKNQDSNAMVIDSKIMKKISTLMRLQALQMYAIICQFSSESFVERLKKNMNISVDEKVSVKKIIKLGKNIKPLVHRSPIFISVLLVLQMLRL